MRRMLSMLLMIAIAGCDLSGLDLSGIDDWSFGDGGGGWTPNPGRIRPVVTASVTFGIGSEFQLQAQDAQGNLVVDSLGTYTSSDSTVLSVTPEGWAVAQSEGTATVYYGQEGAALVSGMFYVSAFPADGSFRLEVHGTTMECLPPFNCTPAGSPIIDGWIGHSTDIAGVNLTFVGAGGLQPADQVSARPTAVAGCQNGDTCVAVAQPSPDHLWRSGDSALCFGVAVGDSVPEIGWVSPANATWEVTWSRPGLFVLRRPFYLWVRPQLDQPTSVCRR